MKITKEIILSLMLVLSLFSTSYAYIKVEGSKISFDENDKYDNVCLYGDMEQYGIVDLTDIETVTEDRVTHCLIVKKSYTKWKLIFNSKYYTCWNLQEIRLLEPEIPRYRVIYQKHENK